MFDIYKNPGGGEAAKAPCVRWPKYATVMTIGKTVCIFKIEFWKYESKWGLKIDNVTFPMISLFMTDWIGFNAVLQSLPPTLMLMI